MKRQLCAYLMFFWRPPFSRQLLHEELLEEDPNAAKPTLGDVKRRYEKTARRLFIKSVVDYVRQGLTLQNIYQRLRA